MTLFLVTAFLLCLLAVILVVLPSSTSKLELDREAINVRFFKDRLEEIKKEKERGLIDAQQYSAAIAEMESGFLTDLPQGEDVKSGVLHNQLSKWWIAFFSTIVIVPLSFGLYFYLGSYQKEKEWTELKESITPLLAGLETGKDIQAELAKFELGEVVAVLQARLQQDESTPQGWLMLALLYSQAGKIELATKAYEKALSLDPTHPAIKIAYAETLMRNNQGRLDNKSAQLLQEVLKQNPQHIRALTLLGMGYYGAGNYEQAISTWQSLLKLMGEESNNAGILKKSIAMAKGAMINQTGNSSPANQFDNQLARLQQLVIQEQQLTPEIETLLRSIFASEPNNPRALAFEGMLSFNSGQYQRAIDTWQRLLKQREPGSERARRIEDSISKARAKLAQIDQRQE